MKKQDNKLLLYTIISCAILMVMLVISYLVESNKFASLTISIGIIFFEITVPFEVLKRIGQRPRDFNIYAHNIDTMLDIFFPPFKRMVNSPDFVGMRKEFISFLAITTIIFVPYIFGYWAYQEFIALRKHMQVVVSWNFPSGFHFLIITQIFVVALPEEIFYRGFLQSSLIKKLPRALPVAIVVIITNIIFALGHVASTMNPMRLITFFPGLIFSYLVLRHKSLLSAILFHAACNILGQVLYVSFYLR